MQKITEMTPAQEQQMEEFCGEWLAVGRATGPANREVVEPIIADFYKRLGKNKPAFWYCESPFQTLAKHCLLYTSDAADE